MDPCSIHQVRISIPDRESFLWKIRKITESRRVHIILLDADRMAGRGHVQSALMHAFRAREKGWMISGRVEVEALLYAAGSRQIVQGAKFGIHEGENRVYLCICPDNRAAWEDLGGLCSPADNEDWETLSPEKITRLCELFSITPQELEVCGVERLPELVIERVALLEVSR